jgi:ribonuclease HI
MEDHELPRGVATVSGTVEVHFDGACDPPKGGGVATFGFHLKGGGFLFEDRGLAVTPYSAHSTNNVAEYVAAIRPLEWLVRQGYSGDVVLMGDSQLVIRQMRGEYAVRADHLKAYHAHLKKLAERFRHVEFRWVPREENARADALSKRALEDVAEEARRHRPTRAVEVPVEDEPPDGLAP